MDIRFEAACGGEGRDFSFCGNGPTGVGWVDFGWIWGLAGWGSLEDGEDFVAQFFGGLDFEEREDPFVGGKVEPTGLERALGGAEEDRAVKTGLWPGEAEG